ncbi:ABC transporter ATP-binding protein [Lactococcus hodotermopsidis]|uniref:ABC transporter ATP-binding protein n=1 Tax=Pseudolactococcus hodotermopsidis TaxID=2709157 RepID=A0A6A0BFQ3_9LACT|nr:ABC transporter ATP-binding protein [Lactococcus hodotermopsidis]GFH43314.1 ABC transporter ATP-binding protein [Lactococcus hodotermopsidis]
MSEKLVIKDLAKSFSVNGGKLEVLKGINLTIADGEFVAIVGHSGCGKSTLLKIIAGLETQDTGICDMDGQAITQPGFDRGMIFQEHRLLPWLTIEKNVALSLNSHSKADCAARVDKYLSMVKLNDFKTAYPSQLSGGMSQRAAIARAMAPSPDVLLLDEPFGALDAMTKIELQDEVKELRKKEKSTMVMVTHDIEEAVYLADRVIVMAANPGRIRDIVTISLGEERDRGSADFTVYRKKIYDYFFESKVQEPEYVI